MLALEEILIELERNDHHETAADSPLPPGFRFHPTDEELITFYLASKVFDASAAAATFSPTIQIAEVDLNRIEPWELPDEAKMGEREWYFFSLRDRKYPTGLRTNRATGAGYWKATGKDKEVYSASTSALLGMKKTLVFYKGRAPRGEKTKWVMHEYRLDGDFSCRHACKEEWVICRIFHKIGDKKTTTQMLHQSQQTAYSSSSPKPNPTFSTLPPLLETQSHQTPQQIMQMLNQNHQDPFLLNTTQESDLKSLINPLVSQYDIFSSNFSNPSSLFSNKPLTSHQDFTLKELSDAIAKQCKKEGFTSNAAAATSSNNYSPFDGFMNMNWVEKIQENNAKYYQNQLLSGIHVPPPASVAVGGHNSVVTTTGSMASSTHVAIDNVMSTEPAFTWW